MSASYMKNISVLAAALSVLSSTAFANPLAQVPSLFKRQSEVESPNYPEWLTGADGGNVKIGINDNKVMYGQKKPSDIMRDQIASYCGTVGTCIGAGTDVDVGSTQYLDGSTLEDLDISFTAVGQYPAWVHNGLIDLLAESIDSQTTTDNVCYDNYANSGCTFASYCPASNNPQICFDQYTAPSGIAVCLYGDGWGYEDVPPCVSVQMTITTPETPAFCSQLASVGAGIAGALSVAAGPAGGLAGIFTLGGVFCQL